MAALVVAGFAQSPGVNYACRANCLCAAYWATHCGAGFGVQQQHRDAEETLLETVLTGDFVTTNGPSASPAASPLVLADGAVRDLTGLGRDELLTLQWEQERAFARQILEAPKGSLARARATSRAYDTVTRIFAARKGTQGGSLVMGLHPRHQRLVLDLLARQWNRGIAARFFEIGYGSGKLLEQVRNAGFPFAGIEVSAVMREQATEVLGPEHRSRLYLGEFLRCETLLDNGPWSLVYWNDVFEHVPPDEIGDWLQRIHRMLVPGGQLITITPNWHMRPSDVTRIVCPPRTEAAGLHLKEYTLREVSDLLRRAGFSHVATPLVTTPRQVVLSGRGLIGVKRALEPALEWLPFRLARLLCRGGGLSCTVASKRL
jgi:SAM-dependent methyltransferase